MPVLLVNNDGTGETSFETDRFALKDLLDEDGSAIIVHALPDNYANIPERYGEVDQDTLETGDSGERIACGAIQKR
jgi:Cu-Zn family superoxide dismutase